MSEEVYKAYTAAQIPMRNLLDRLVLTAEQIVPLSQLAGSIVDGCGTNKADAPRIVGAYVATCRQRGVPEESIRPFIEFGIEWAIKFHPEMKREELESWVVAS